MSENKRITMAQLAKMAEVDVSTVSRALNDSQLVNPKTRKHILKIADKVGYVVNVSARNLRRNSSQTLGIVIPLNPDSGQTISDPFFLEMVGAVSQAASIRGYDLIVSVPQDEQSIAEKRLLQTGRADGLIVIGQAGRTDRLNTLDSWAKNIVVWGGLHGETNYTLVGSDNTQGGALAAKHLLGRGCQNILFLGDYDLPEVALRYEGFKTVFASHGQRHDPQSTARVAFGSTQVFELIRGLMATGNKFDGIFAASDVLAIAAIHAINSLGLRVPEDVAVIGYDNIGQAALVTPALTTIDQNIKHGGEALVDLLVQKISGNIVSGFTTKTELVVRKSA